LPGYLSVCALLFVYVLFRLSRLRCCVALVRSLLTFVAFHSFYVSFTTFYSLLRSIHVCISRVHTFTFTRLFFSLSLFGSLLHVCAVFSRTVRCGSTLCTGWFASRLLVVQFTRTRTVCVCGCGLSHLSGLRFGLPLWIGCSGSGATTAVRSTHSSFAFGSRWVLHGYGLPHHLVRGYGSSSALGSLFCHAARTLRFLLLFRLHFARSRITHGTCMHLFHWFSSRVFCLRSFLRNARFHFLVCARLAFSSGSHFLDAFLSFGSASPFAVLAHAHNALHAVRFVSHAAPFWFTASALPGCTALEHTRRFVCGSRTCFHAHGCLNKRFMVQLHGSSFTRSGQPVGHIHVRLRTHRFTVYICLASTVGLYAPLDTTVRSYGSHFCIAFHFAFAHTHCILGSVWMFPHTWSLYAHSHTTVGSVQLFASSAFFTNSYLFVPFLLLFLGWFTLTLFTVWFTCLHTHHVLWIVLADRSRIKGLHCAPRLRLVGFWLHNTTTLHSAGLPGLNMQFTGLPCHASRCLRTGLLTPALCPPARQRSPLRGFAPHTPGSPSPALPHVCLSRGL